jgi:hypothetical protein
MVVAAEAQDIFLAVWADVAQIARVGSFEQEGLRRAMKGSWCPRGGPMTVTLGCSAA